MKKKGIIILVAVSMLIFGSMAFAGDKNSTSQNRSADTVMLASNSQASPQVVNEAMENFRVEQEEMGQSMLLAIGEASDNCDLLCEIYRWGCTTASPSDPPPPNCDDICNACRCTGCP